MGERLVRRSSRRWCRGLLRTATPETVAALRVVVAALLLWTTVLSRAPRLAALPVELRAPPVGFQAMSSWLPIGEGVVGVAQGALILTSSLSLLGLWTRWSLAATTLLGWYVLGVPQLYGDSIHYHHLMWLAALLAVSPCGDVWSIDALRHGRTERPRRVYAVALVAAWLLLACVYFFPGLWKIRSSGLRWITSDHLIHLMHQKWLMRSTIPAIRVDRFPSLVKLGGALVLAFELSMPLLVLLSPASRRVAVGAGMVFHGATALWFHIYFPSLWLTYVMLVDVRGIARSSLRGASSKRHPRRPGSWPSAVTGGVGALIVGGAMAFGVAGIRHGWPFACYPTFDRLTSARVVLLRAIGRRPDGREIELLVRGAPPGEDAPRWWAMTTSLATGTPSPHRLRAFAETLAARPEVAEEQLTSIRLERALRSVAPATWQEPPIRSQPLFVLPLDAD